MRRIHFPFGFLICFILVSCSGFVPIEIEKEVKQKTKENVLDPKAGLEKKEVNPYAYLGEKKSKTDWSKEPLFRGLDVNVNVPFRLHSDPRKAVVYEAFYALNPRHDGTSRRKLNGWTISDWNYLYSDMNAYWRMRDWYGCYSSMWGWDGKGCAYKAMWWNSFYRSVSSYGRFGNTGRGGQCKYFANLIVYRSGVYNRAFPGYAVMKKYYCRSIRYAQPGDVIFTTGGCAGDHTAIVVQNLGGDPSRGSVWKVDVVDSNYITWGGYDEEIIGRHVLVDQGSRCSASNLKKYCVFNIY